MKKRSVLIALLAIAVLVFGPNSVLAKEVAVEDNQTIQSVIDAETTVDGDVIVLPEGTYTGNITLDKAVTLKGADKEKTIIKGQIVVSADTVVQDLTISAKGLHGAGIKVVSTADVTVSNVVIEYDGYVEAEGDYGTNDYFRGIWLEKDNSDGSKLLVENSEIYAKYGIHLRSANNEVTIKNSSITGYAALDISNAPATTTNTLAENNIVSIEGSTLTGVTAASGATNHYGTIIIGGQKNLQLVIENSTVTNRIVDGKENQADLIRFGAGYLTSESVVIAIANSEIINTDTTYGSEIVNFMTEENTLGGSMVIIENTTTITPAEQEVIATYGDNVILTLSTVEGDVKIAVPKGFEMTEDMLVTDEVEGYTFDGWYADEEYTTEFVAGTLIEDDTTIYAKFTKITSEEENKTTTENPDTLDNSLTYFVAAIISVIGLMLTTLRITKKSN